jgi:hypothetical protein
LSFCQRTPINSTAPSQCVKAVLLAPCAAALDQDNQHNQKQRTGNNPNNQGTVHVKSPFLRKQVKKLQIPTGFGSRLALVPQSSRSVPAAAEFADFPGRRWFQSVDVLLGAGAAALNQDAQNDNKQNAGNNANQSGGIHCNPLSDSFMSHGQEPVEDSPTCYVEVLRHSHSSSCEAGWRVLAFAIPARRSAQTAQAYTRERRR